MHTHGHHRHGHGDDDWADLAGNPVHRVLTVVAVVVGVAAVVGMVVWWPRGESQVDRSALDFGDRVDATVTEADVGPCSFDPTEECNAVRFRITEGAATGSIGSFEISRTADTPAGSLVAGDDIVVNDGGEDLPAASRFSFADRERDSSLLLLAVVFAGAVVALGRLRGLLALAGIAVTLGMLVVYVFPALLHGSPPIGVAVTGSAVMAYVVLYLAHGISHRTTVALVGTLSSLGITALLAVAFARAAELSGLASEESVSLLAFAPDLDFRGLLLAAVIIGTLGVLDDVTVTQVSAVWELHRSDPASTGPGLYRAATRIGRDHIASTVNTLVLAYAAAALPLLLLYTQSGLSFGEVLTNETVAVEIVQTLVGSIGLVASVPITTGLACWVVTRSDAASPRRPAGSPSGPRQPSLPPLSGGGRTGPGAGSDRGWPPPRTDRLRPPPGLG